VFTVAPFRVVIGILVLCAVVGSVEPTVARAATSSISCPEDDLQAALDAAAPGDTLHVSGTCPGLFTIAKRLTLVGGPGATLDGGDAGTTLTVTAHDRVLLRGLTITGGSDVGGGDGAGIRNAGRLVIRGSYLTGNGGDLESSKGGAISNSGSLEIHGSILRRNGFNGFFSQGGGIYNTGDVSIWGSTLRHNGAYDGGNLWNAGVALVQGSTIGNGFSAGAGGIENSGRLTLTNSTVVNNESFFIGGIDNSGIAQITNTTITGNGGAVGGLTSNGGTMTLTNTTVSANIGTDFEGPGGISIQLGTVVLRSSIVAANTGVTIADCGGKLSTKGYNLIGDADGCTVTAAVGDLIGSATGSGAIDARLGPLADNGGRTQTMALLSDSPARDAIPIGATATGGFALCPASGTTDQRLIPRPQGPACDIGAFERQTP
jgi:hypothetical protein